MPAGAAVAGVRAGRLGGGARGRFCGGRLGGVALVVTGALSTQFGAAVAALLFPRAGALGVVTLRLTLAAALLMLIFRPRVRGHSRGDWAVLCGFGVALGGMNMAIYQAIDRIPLGAAVTLEVLGPLTLSVLAGRRVASLLWAALALGGVVLLSGGGFGGLDPAGVAFALGAGCMWATYIVMSARAGARFPRADGLAIAMSVGAVISLPVGVASAGGRLVDPATLGLGLAVAVMSSGLPYALDQFALRRLPAATFALMMSLAPAVAALAGYLVLDQGLTAVQCAAIGMVIAASIGAVRTPPRPAARPEGA
ncbi:EamA family transporter [Streptomyces sp. NBC_01808]|uniref:EamA family transporter n=1 Tax=Streptomyces sp. NBC_01808 TaxID=2975947 RepID=UPI002DDC3B0F|nr:EamA family transporter [Streptomyces sp. NBC_01808]WSA40521.1 EamA family transporter [Streptomyces sp. NBC_01808]